MTKIIAFSGRAGHGKDTSADFLEKLIKEETDDCCEIVRFAFADILKDITMKSLSLGPESMDYLKRNRNIMVANGQPLRNFINLLGDAIKDNFGYDIWAEKMVQNINQTINAIKPKYIFITDLRYPVEEAHLRKYFEDTTGVDLTILKLVRRLPTDQKNPEEYHESEYLVDEVQADLTLTAGSVQELEKKLKDFYESISK